jgi:hypothetical protein
MLKERSELDRRARALGEARRINEYLPKLRALEERLEQELEVVRALINDEEAALEDLLYEGRNTTAAVARREEARRTVD